MFYLLTADIGATNSRFAYFQCEKNGKLSLVESFWFKTQEFPSFVHLIDHVKKSDFSLSVEETDIAVFAIAGPVERQTYSNPPYISWNVDISNAEADFGLRRCYLINDFVAQAFACRTPIMESAEKIVSGDVDFKSPLVVIGAGTNLGQAALVPQNTTYSYVAIPSEGGHTPFPFESELEFDYMNFLLEKVPGPYVIANTVVSGKGLSLVHQFLSGEKLEPAEVAAGLTENSETLKWMARFYGRVCRNYALQVLAFGGVYIAGGVAAKLPLLVTHEEFTKEFRRSETMGHVLNNIPVFLNLNEESGLWGAALMGMHAVKELDKV